MTTAFSQRRKEYYNEIKRLTELNKSLEEQLEDKDFTIQYLADKCKELEGKRIYYRTDREKKLKVLEKIIHLDDWYDIKDYHLRDIHSKYEFITEVVGDFHNHFYTNWKETILKGSEEYSEEFSYDLRVYLEKHREESDSSYVDEKILVELYNQNNDTEITEMMKGMNIYKTMMYGIDLFYGTVVSHFEEETTYIYEMCNDRIEMEIDEGRLMFTDHYNSVVNDMNELRGELDDWKTIGEKLENSKWVEDRFYVKIPDTMIGEEVEGVVGIINYIAQRVKELQHTKSLAYEALKSNLDEDELDMMLVVEKVQSSSEELVSKNLELVELIKSERKDFNRLLNTYKEERRITDRNRMSQWGHFTIGEPWTEDPVIHTLMLTDSFIHKLVYDGQFDLYISPTGLCKIDSIIGKIINEHMVGDTELEKEIRDTLSTLPLEKIDDASFVEYGGIPMEERKKEIEVRKGKYNKQQVEYRKGRRERTVDNQFYNESKDLIGEDLMNY